MWVQICSILIAIITRASSTEFGCRDENNEIVDWYFLYKLPKEATDRHSPLAGLHYAFMTSNGENKWKLSARAINESASIPGNTLGPVLTNSQTILSLLYNDEPPISQTDEARGHTKGVVATDGTTGFWLIHSVPKYPPELGKTYMYPTTGQIYGQSFLCITVSADQMDTIGQQLIMNEPHVYSFSIPDELRNRFPSLVRATDMHVVDMAPYWSTAAITSQAGETFYSFAKSRHFKKELYADFIAPSLKVNMMVETWQHGTGNLPSDCNTSQWQVINVKRVAVANEYKFTTLKDHSKWAVTMEGDKGFICVGDINRQEHQKVRGGGSVCSPLEAIANVYRGTVADVESCPKDLNFV